MTNEHVCRYLELLPDGGYFCGGCQKTYRLAPVEPGDERECALQDIAYRNGAQQALAMAHQSLKAADEWLAGLWERTREARSVLNRRAE